MSHSKGHILPLKNINSDPQPTAARAKPSVAPQQTSSSKSLSPCAPPLPSSPANGHRNSSQIKAAIEKEKTEPNDLNLSVGSRVIISRPSSKQPYASIIERLSTVTAVRSKSFDAGGLCFRKDGREWNGHNRARLLLSDEAKEHLILQVGVEEVSRAGRASEDALLAFLISSRHERDWLKLGLAELRRIATLHGILARHPQPLEAFDADSQE